MLYRCEDGASGFYQAPVLRLFDRMRHKREFKNIFEAAGLQRSPRTLRHPLQLHYTGDGIEATIDVDFMILTENPHEKIKGLHGILGVKLYAKTPNSPLAQTLDTTLTDYADSVAATIIREYTLKAVPPQNR